MGSHDEQFLGNDSWKIKDHFKDVLLEISEQGVNYVGTIKLLGHDNMVVSRWFKVKAVLSL